MKQAATAFFLFCALAGAPSSCVAETPAERLKVLESGIKSMVALQRTTISALTRSSPHNGLCTSSAGNERFLRRTLTELRQMLHQAPISKRERSRALQVISEGERRMTEIERLLEERFCRLAI